MNLEAFLWTIGPLNLQTVAPGTPVPIPFKDRRGIDFGLKKEIVRGSWRSGNLFLFEGFSEKGGELVRLAQGDIALRRALEERFPTATAFHVKSALKFIASREAGTPPAAE